MNIRATLEAARALIADPEHWVQGTYATTRDGNEVYPDESNACHFCAYGALARVSGVVFATESGNMQTTELYEVCSTRLQDKAAQLYQCGMIASINDGELSEDDDPTAAHKQIINIYDAAIRDAG